ncbi:MAG TPA: hypothetical protein P5511_07010, partial [Candidatus Goldiibacteriota bacterium]|nr:hypothetical protein [Candidatus Goldiibacteriota bacterium]
PETAGEKLMPGFNLKRRTLADLLDFEQLTEKYYYVERATGKAVNVPRSEVKKNSAGRLYQEKTGKFVIKRSGIPVAEGNGGDGKGEGTFFKKAKEFIRSDEVKMICDLMKFDIIETGPHSVLVASFKDHEKFFKGRVFPDRKKILQLPDMTALSLARVDGGSMDFWDLDGASYSPHLDRVILPSLAAIPGFDALGNADFGVLGDYAKEAVNAVEENVLLH